MNDLIHTGVMGMRWGRRGSTSTSSKISGLSNKNKELKTTLDKTITKSEKNKVKVDKLTKKLTKRGNYLTDIGYTMAKTTGRKLSRKLNKDKKLDIKIAKINKRLTTNKQSIQTMRTQMKDLKANNIASGKAFVNS